MLAMFVNFMFSNVVFMHLHRDNAGHTYMHSHPYQPKTQHSHDSHALDLITVFNSAAHSAHGEEAPALFAPVQTITAILTTECEAIKTANLLGLELRGPPAK